MGLFSRLKKAFSLPESEAASSAASTSTAAETTDDSQATAAVTATSTASAEPATSTATTVAAPTTPTVVEVTATSSVPASAASGAPVVSAEADVVDSQATNSASSAAASLAPASEPAASEVAESNVEPSVEPATAAAEPTEAERYDQGLKKSRQTFGDRINNFLANFRHVDEGFFDELEDTLIESDVGYETAMQISDELRDEVKLKNAKSKKEISSVIVEKLVDMYGEAGAGEDNSIHLAASGPTVILFVGVNGAGKTTTIGKMANMYKQQGKKVLLAACDTFRAGAIQQLQVWGKRDGVDVVAGPEKSDPAAVCFDAVKRAKAEAYDILFVDTAGRLQNKVNLMNELEKIKRVITREIPAAPQEVLLVLDATTGQNALNQAKLFKQSTAVTGIVLTKLDGTARGGIVLAIRNELHLAVKYVGLGEKVTDLRPFNANDFVYGLFKDVITG
ncbi:signal recognition particle-docking protein FtsY [Lactobacillus sp. CBA3606]|uniref:signal recognition particle-docking protein FtsY n=1 Tax=Lactobacillus sp. CBA3606 TaxID=2099789 RepID=UPI000CFCAE70|nr:signal recognition particle-docking protein FtsY [Lactobacillus sp. CBA3606]AVK62957.1 signal recognition particle-docking protein FtsY [Lactobacillus sp. CBA3606]